MAGKPQILMLSLGGTIAMLPDAEAGGVVPSLQAEDLVAAVPGLAEVASVRTESFRQVPGAHLTLEDVVALAEKIRRELAGGELGGIVITQGTDTLEEVAFALDLLVPEQPPVVVTGAMRAAHLAGADGPANLLDAVSVAVSPRLRGLGTVVVLGGEIHAARLVVKGHTQSPAAFVSPLAGPLGWIAEGRPRLALAPLARPALDFPLVRRPGRVALLTASLGDDGGLVRAAAAGYEGMVIEALGAGHLPAAALDALDEAVAAMPVVLASRTQAGEILRATYGFPGSETDLLGRGLLSSEWLGARKARILLSPLLAAPGAAEPVAERLARYLAEAAPA